MKIYDPIAEALGIECSHKIDYSNLKDHSSSEYSKYATYGGGGAGELNGMWNKKHTEETKELIRQKAIGRPSPTKGMKFPSISKRMRLNNPMKNPEIAAKVAAKLRGKIPWNKGNRSEPCPRIHIPTENPNNRKKTLWTFPDGKEVLVENTKEMCEKHGISYSAVRHKIGKGPYLNKPNRGLRIDRVKLHDIT